MQTGIKKTLRQPRLSRRNKRRPERRRLIEQRIIRSVKQPLVLIRKPVDWGAKPPERPTYAPIDLASDTLRNRTLQAAYAPLLGKLQYLETLQETFHAGAGDAVQPEWVRRKVTQGTSRKRRLRFYVETIVHFPTTTIRSSRGFELSPRPRPSKIEI